MWQVSTAYAGHAPVRRRRTLAGSWLGFWADRRCGFNRGGLRKFRKVCCLRLWHWQEKAALLRGDGSLHMMVRSQIFKWVPLPYGRLLTRNFVCSRVTHRTPTPLKAGGEDALTFTHLLKEFSRQSTKKGFCLHQIGILVMEGSDGLASKREQAEWVDCGGSSE